MTTEGAHEWWSYGRVITDWVLEMVTLSRWTLGAHSVFLYSQSFLFSGPKILRNSWYTVSFLLIFVFQISSWAFYSESYLSLWTVYCKSTKWAWLVLFTGAMHSLAQSYEQHFFGPVHSRSAPHSRLQSARLRPGREAGHCPILLAPNWEPLPETRRWQIFPRSTAECYQW